MKQTKTAISISNNYKYTVDSWDGHICRYRMDDEEVGGLSCFESFRDAKQHALKVINKNIVSLQGRLLMIESMRVSDVS